MLPVERGQEGYIVTRGLDLRNGGPLSAVTKYRGTATEQSIPLLQAPLGHASKALNYVSLVSVLFLSLMCMSPLRIKGLLVLTLVSYSFAGSIFDN